MLLGKQLTLNMQVTKHVTKQYFVHYITNMYKLTEEENPERTNEIDRHGVKWPKIHCFT